MEDVMKRVRPYLTVLACALTVLVSSCSKMFPNDELDNMWRLDAVCYLDGKDFEGNSRWDEEKDDTWYCFARDLVEVRSGRIHGPIGVVTDYKDSIRLDFSMYEDIYGINPQGTLKALNDCGIPSLTTTFKVERITGEKMILKCDRTSLFFTRW